MDRRLGHFRSAFVQYDVHVPFGLCHSTVAEKPSKEPVDHRAPTLPTARGLGFSHPGPSPLMGLRAFDRAKNHGPSGWNGAGRGEVGRPRSQLLEPAYSSSDARVLLAAHA